MPKQPSQSYWPGPNFINRLVNFKCFELISQEVGVSHPHTKPELTKSLEKSSFRQNQTRLGDKQPWKLLRAHGPGHDSHPSVPSYPTQDKHSSVCGSNLELSSAGSITHALKSVLCAATRAEAFLRAWDLLKGQVGSPFGSGQILEKGEAGLEALSWEERGLFSFLAHPTGKLLDFCDIPPRSPLLCEGTVCSSLCISSPNLGCTGIPQPPW